MRKFFLQMLLVGLLSVAFIGCGSKNGAVEKEKREDQNEAVEKENHEDQNEAVEKENHEEQNSTVTTEVVDFSPEGSIKIEDIVWSVSESVLDGRNFISFDYTNNSQYDIYHVKLTFVQKSGVSSADLEVFSDIKNKNNLSDEDIAGVYIEGRNYKWAEPKETVNNSPCYINSTPNIVVESMDQYNLVEPSKMEISFVGTDGKGYTLNYDYELDKYEVASQEGVDLQQWSDSKISEKLPKNRFKRTFVTTDEENKFTVNVSGVGREDFDTYRAQIQEAAFSNIIFEGKNVYQAHDGQYKVYLIYNELLENLQIIIEVYEAE